MKNLLRKKMVQVSCASFLRVCYRYKDPTVTTDELYDNISSVTVTVVLLEYRNVFYSALCNKHTLVSVT